MYSRTIVNFAYPISQSRPATVALTEYLLKNNLNADGTILTDAVMNDLMETLSTNSTSNAAVIPALLTLDALIENGVATLASSTEKGAMMYCSCYIVHPALTVP
jgi:phage gpG-like protein